ncbi:MAG: ATP-dependent RecD-like DNA helicase [Lentisphaerae bacterium]|nr:ATP-dependent RecD-like DNA helicase [Lentisphaerota bacterium]
MNGKPHSSNGKRQAPGDEGHVTGVVESIVYRSEDTGYTVCSVRIAGKNDTSIVVGNCPAMWVGETLEAEGQWVRHRRHGTQFQADTITCIPPTSTKGIEKYLAGGMIRGIGPVMAERLVRRFGEDTLRIIEKESKRLQEIEGIGPVRRGRIKESWTEQKAVRDIMIFLQSHGVGTAQSARIYRHYGGNSVNAIRENPYRLCEDIWGIGFKTADSVGMSLGVPRDSEVRARAGLVHVLRTLADEGHCYCPGPELILQAQALLDIPVETLASALNDVVERGKLVRENDRVFIPALHRAEVSIAERLESLMDTPTPFKPIDVDKAVPWAEQRMKISFSPEQGHALRMALSQKVSVITGGPGVGKTTIIRALVDVFKVRKLVVALAAPTGRAAKRMEESTAHEAKTIHRMLKFLPAKGRFDHGPDNPVPGDVFILDEVSMMDALLMSSFLGALPPQASLVLVGDVDQLPSVGPGNVLRDLIESKSLPVTRLETIFRQEAESAIVENAHRVNHGETLRTGDDGGPSDFYFIECDEPDLLVKRIVELVTTRIPSRFGFDPMNDVQVLSPMRRNQLGSENLNEVLQGELNPSGTELSRFGRKYRVRDRVMQIRNNYDKDVFNGDIGRIASVDPVEQELVVNFDGRKVEYSLNELDELIHAYACSIHKSQGSEYPAVVIALATQHFKLLQRNLLYTALTRGRKLVCLVGSKKAVWIAVNNNEIRMRRTSLQERLQKERSVGSD